MRKLKVLILADQKDRSLLDSVGQNENWDILWYVDEYKNLHKKIPEINKLAVENHIALLMYARNDQIGERYSIAKVTRQTRLGYSSFSGIDENYAVQMTECFRDFLNCPADWAVKSHQAAPAGNRKQAAYLPKNEYTYSLIFDTEQIACVRYGLPRLLTLLDRYQFKATFFVTNLLNRVYPKLGSLLWQAGHEVGIHGLYHEYLSGRDRQEQAETIKEMLEDWGVEITGANFMGRMDPNTIEALAQNRLCYFTYDAVFHHRRLAYAKTSLLPRLLQTATGAVWAVPVTVSTYGYSLFTVKNMIRASIRQGKKDQYPHFNILCHPFRDGNLRNLGNTKKLLEFLSGLGYRAVTVNETLPDLSLQQGDDRSYWEGSINIFNPKRVAVAWPVTRDDLFGILTENILAIYKVLRRGRNVY